MDKLNISFNRQEAISRKPRLKRHNLFPCAVVEIHTFREFGLATPDLQSSDSMRLVGVTTWKKNEDSPVPSPVTSQDNTDNKTRNFSYIEDRTEFEPTCQCWNNTSQDRAVNILVNDFAFTVIWQEEFRKYSKFCCRKIEYEDRRKLERH